MLKLPQFARRAAALLLLPLLAEAAALDPEAARERLLRYIEQTESYAAEFTQRLTDTEGRVEDAGGGRFWLARPAQFKWLYERPFAREIVADGARIWLYDAELDQVTVRNLDEILATTPAGLLAGATSNLEAYEFSGTSTAAGVTIVLTPTAARSDFERISMRLEGNALKRLTLDDRFGQQTQIEFTGARINEPVDPGVFEFTVPADADVIDETGSD